MYNLLAGFAFFFEDYSADVIGILLGLGRNGEIRLTELEEVSGISEESLTPFIEQLMAVGLICDGVTDQAVVEAYRSALKEQGVRSSYGDSPLEQLTVAQSDAEKAYLKRAGILTGAVMFELTYNCSERCVHCYNPGAVRNDSEVSGRGRVELGLDDYKRIIDDLYGNGLFKVCLTGGDPFSKPEVWQIIDYLYRKDIAIEIYTNGQRLWGNEEKLAAFFPSDVGISVYGPDASVHDGVTRIPGSFDKTMAVLGRLTDLNIPVAIKCSLMRHTVRYYPEMYELADRFHAELQVECRLFDGLDGDKSVTRNLRLTEEQLSIVFRDPRNAYYVGKELPDYGAIPQDMEHIACRAGVKNFCITPEGFLIPCCSYHAVIGDLKESTVKELLSDNEEYDKMLSTPISSYVECGRHDYCSFCKMCPGLNFAENGSPLEAAENNCFLAKTRLKVVRQLADGLDPLLGRQLVQALEDVDEPAVGAFSRLVFCSHFNKPLTIERSSNSNSHEDHA